MIVWSTPHWLFVPSRLEFWLASSAPVPCTRKESCPAPSRQNPLWSNPDLNGFKSGAQCLAQCPGVAWTPPSRHLRPPHSQSLLPRCVASCFDDKSRRPCVNTLPNTTCVQLRVACTSECDDRQLRPSERAENTATYKDAPGMGAKCGGRTGRVEVDEGGYHLLSFPAWPSCSSSLCRSLPLIFPCTTSPSSNTIVESTTGAESAS